MTGGTYSQRWFEVFGEMVDPAQTEREVEFILRMVPRTSATPRVLDVCCGSGRHANCLAARGYQVIGIDCDEGAIERARRNAVHGAEFRIGDLRSLQAFIPPGERSFDAVICMWQSFGQFSDDENQRVLSDMAKTLNDHGVMLLDVYNPEFFRSRLGVRSLQRNGRTVIETKELHDDRLAVTLDYGDNNLDRFNWRLYSMDEWQALADRCGIRLMQACTDFDEQHPPSPDQPRMQLIFVKSEDPDSR